MDLRKEALHDALLSSNLPRLKALLKASPALLNAPLNEMGQTLMHLVCFRTTNRQEILRYLLSLRPDLNLCEAAGFTPLLYAAKSGLWATCILLFTTEPMGRGLRVNVQTATGWNLLLMLCAAEKPEGDELEEYLSLLRLVHSRGVDYAAVSKHGETGLHCAAISNNTNAAEFLLANSPIHVDAVNDMGESALNNAVRAGHGEAAMLLLEYGANPSLVCSRNNSADVVRSPMQELEQRLQKRGSVQLQQLYSRMQEVVDARSCGKTLAWLRENQADAASERRPLSPVKGFLASKTGGRSEDQRARAPGLTLGGQRTSSSSTVDSSILSPTSASLPAGSEDAARLSRAATVKAPQPQGGGGVASTEKESTTRESSGKLEEPVFVAPLVECFDELASLAANVQKLVRKRAGKLYSVGTASKKEKTCLATIAMLVRRISSQRGSFRNFKNMMENSVSVRWDPIVGVSTSNVQWAAIFHHRMLQCGQLLGIEKVQSILEVLDFYQSMAKKKSLALSRLETSTSGPFIPAAELGQVELDAILVNDMRNHLLSHSLDPDNSLVGLRPSARLVGSLAVDLASMHAACSAFDDSSRSSVEQRATGAPLKSRARASSAAHQGSMQYAAFPASAYPSVTKRDLTNVFVNQLRFASDEELLIKSRALIQILQHDQVHARFWEECKSLKRGDLVIAYTPRATAATSFESFDSHGDLEGMEDAVNAGYSLMRYSGAYTEYWMLGGEIVSASTPGAYRGCSLRLYSIPEEVTQCDVDVRVVVPLPLGSRQRIEKGSVSVLEELVDGPISASIRHVLSGMSALHSSLLQAKGVDVVTLRRCTTFSIGLKDIEKIVAQHRLLTALVKNFGKEFKEFLEDMRKAIEKRHCDLVSKMRVMDREFFPLRDTRLQQLLDLPIEVLLRNRLESYKLNIESAFDHLRHVKEGLVDGTQKKNITSWWLDMISTRQRTFLREIGYDFDAVPSDYIETQPENIDVVCENLSLIKECLLQNESKDKHNVKERLLYPLMNEIYPRVNEFISNIRFSLCDGLGISPEEFSLESANVLLKECAGSEQHTFLSGLLKDLEYLETIKELEAEFMGADWESICGITTLTVTTNANETAEALAEMCKKGGRRDSGHGGGGRGGRGGKAGKGGGGSASHDSAGTARKSCTLKVSNSVGDRVQRRSIEMGMKVGTQLVNSGSLLRDIRSSSESVVNSPHARKGKNTSGNLSTVKKSLAARDQNIVPMSGLIMNIFYRLENELRTVLEVWALERLEAFDERERISSAPQISPRSLRLLEDSESESEGEGEEGQKQGQNQNEGSPSPSLSRSSTSSPPDQAHAFRTPSDEGSLNRRRTRRLRPFSPSEK